jgi:hypothetical protein
MAEILEEPIAFGPHAKLHRSDQFLVIRGA